jgi:hypothetical protein
MKTLTQQDISAVNGAKSTRPPNDNEQPWASPLPSVA